MGKWQHRLSNVDGNRRIADCAVCGNVRIRLKPRSNGRSIWCCRNALKKWNGNLTGFTLNKDKPRPHKGDICFRCGFVAEHRCQLDRHHVDGNHFNDKPHNVQTLCANCHRLIHFGNKTSS